MLNTKSRYVTKLPGMQKAEAHTTKNQWTELHSLLLYAVNDCVSTVPPSIPSKQVDQLYGKELRNRSKVCQNSHSMCIFVFQYVAHVSFLC